MIARVGVTLAAAAAAVTGFALAAPASGETFSGQEAECPAGTAASRVESLLAADASGGEPTVAAAVETMYAEDNALDAVPSEVDVVADDGAEVTVDVLDAAGDPVGRVELAEFADGTYEVHTILACRQVAQ